MSLLVYNKVIPYTKFAHFGIIRFWSYAADRQTNKQTVSNVLPTSTDIVDVGNYRNYCIKFTDTRRLGDLLQSKVNILMPRS